MSGNPNGFWMVWSVAEWTRQALLSVTEVSDGFVMGNVSVSHLGEVSGPDGERLGDRWKKQAALYARQARDYLPPNSPGKAAPGQLTIHIIRERGESFYG
jgi:hypothetical protein